MHDFSIVAVLKSKTHLRKVIQDLILREVLLVSPSLSDLLAQVTSICPFHNNVQVDILVLENVVEADYIRVIEDLEYSGFISCYRPLGSRHILHVDNLDHILFLREARLSNKGRALAIFKQLHSLLVSLLLLFWLLNWLSRGILCLNHSLIFGDLSLKF